MWKDIGFIFFLLSQLMVWCLLLLAVAILPLGRALGRFMPSRKTRQQRLKQKELRKVLKVVYGAKGFGSTSIRTKPPTEPNES